MGAIRCAIVLCFTLHLGAIGGAQAPAASSDEAAAILGAAHQALGGEKRLTSLKTVVTTGRTRQVRGENLVPIEFEISIEFPDKYVRRDEIPAQETGPTSRGFNGDLLIEAPEAPASPDKTAALKQDFARLTLGMLALSFSAYPLTFGYAGQAEAPEGKADVLDVRGPDGFAARLFIDSSTHLPLMLSWTVPPTLVPVSPGQPPPPSLPPGATVFEAPGPPPGPSASADERAKFQQEMSTARAKALASATPIENRIYYADYREVDGFRFPFRIRRAIGATTTEETLIDRYRTNVRIDPKRFEVRK
jgi:hypothetical protein